MRNIFNRIINSYDKKVPRSVIFVACFLGFCLKDESNTIQIVICSVLLIFLLAVIPKMIKDGKSRSYIGLAIMAIMTTLLVTIFKVIEGKNIDTNKFFIIFEIVFFSLVISIMIFSYKITLEEEDESRIRQVKLGIVLAIISLIFMACI